MQKGGMHWLVHHCHLPIDFLIVIDNGLYLVITQSVDFNRLVLYIRYRTHLNVWILFSFEHLSGVVFPLLPIMMFF